MAIDLDRTRHSILNDLAKRTPGFACQGKLGAFVDRYLVADALANKLVSFYVTDTSVKATRTLHISQLNSAIRHFSFAFTTEQVRAVFQSGIGARSKKSPRQLRNAYFHSLSKNDRLEIEDRLDELMLLLDNFVVVICLES